MVRIGTKWVRALSVQWEIRPKLQGVPYWLAACLVGVIAVLYSGAFSGVIAFSQAFALEHPHLLFVFSPVCFVLSTWLVKSFAPQAGGTGVPTVTSTLRKDYRSSLPEIESALSLKVMLVIIASSLLCVLGGAGLGREGPMVHIAACIFYFVAVQVKRIWPYEDHRSWIIAGGAAGVAAAFNTPLAGIVFVLEELAEQHFHQFKTVTISAVIVAGMMAQWLSGRYLFLGYPRMGTVSVGVIPWGLLVGIACGVGVVVFERLLHEVSKVTQRFRLRYLYAFSAFMGICAAGLAVFVNHRTIGGGILTIQELLFTGERASWWLLLGRFFSTIFGHLSGAAGGFLAPALSLGAIIGSKVAWLVSPQDHNLFVMIGMAGFLSAMTRAPFTALVIVMEMTDRHSAIFALMIGSLTSFGVAKWLGVQTKRLGGT